MMKAFIINIVNKAVLKQKNANALILGLQEFLQCKCACCGFQFEKQNACWKDKGFLIEINETLMQVMRSKDIMTENHIL